MGDTILLCPLWSVFNLHGPCCFLILLCCHVADIRISTLWGQQGQLRLPTWLSIQEEKGQGLSRCCCGSDRLCRVWLWGHCIPISNAWLLKGLWVGQTNRIPGILHCTKEIDSGRIDFTLGQALYFVFFSLYFLSICSLFTFKAPVVNCCSGLKPLQRLTKLGFLTSPRTSTQIST